MKSPSTWISVIIILRLETISCFIDYNFVSVQGYTLTSVCILGIIANCLTCIVLSRYDVFSTFTKLLASLAIVDSILLTVFLIDSGLPALFGQAEWYLQFVPFVYPLKVIMYK